MWRSLGGTNVIFLFAAAVRTRLITMRSKFIFLDCYGVIVVVVVVLIVVALHIGFSCGQ